jgi:transposase-like protein
MTVRATETRTRECKRGNRHGYRESTQSWRELLQQLKRHGLTVAPKLALGDGSLGFWLALQEEYGPVPQQRCWVHKTANILDKMPKSVQGRAKEFIHEMYLSPTRKTALEAYDQFIASYQAKYPKQPTAWKKTNNGCSPFMTSRLNTGPIFGRLTPSNQPLLPCAFAPSEPKGVAHGSRP